MRLIAQLHRVLLCRTQLNMQIVSLKLGPKLSKDFKIAVDLCYAGDSEKALTHAVVTLVKEAKLLRETDRVAFIKVVDKFFDGDEDRAKREALNDLLKKYQVRVDE